MASENWIGQLATAQDRYDADCITARNMLLQSKYQHQDAEQEGRARKQKKLELEITFPK